MVPERLRTLFKCVSFGAVLLWILCGSYVRQESPAHDLGLGARPGDTASTWKVLRRHLLSAEGDLGGTECNDMYYANHSSMVDPENDQVWNRWQLCNSCVCIVWSLQSCGGCWE